MKIDTSHIPEFSDDEKYNSLFLGKAGERYVAARMLRLGFNAAETPVDYGTDILAYRTSKGGENLLYQVQVKTVSGKSWSKEYDKEKFEKFYKEGINLVVLFWGNPEKPVAVVLPPSLLYFLSRASSIGIDIPIYPKDKDSKKVIRVGYLPQKNKAYIRKQAIDISPMIGCWSILEEVMNDAFAIPPFVEWNNEKTVFDFVPK